MPEIGTKNQKRDLRVRRREKEEAAMDRAVAEAIKALSCPDPRARQGAANRFGGVLP
ncbi:MAG: hypothetical protein L6R30_25030 [Thermoanaerobaculia bacterium]|nr:hypothetical protein [Thermoanaerobaculia bacterium]